MLSETRHLDFNSDQHKIIECELKMLYTEREKALKSLLLLETTKENNEFVNKEVFKEVSIINQSLTVRIQTKVNFS